MASKTYKWLVVALLWGVALLNYLDRQMLSTMKASMQASIPELQTAANFGYLMAIFLWIYGLMSPVAGIVADRFNRKWIIVISLFVWSSVTFLMGYTTSFNQLFWLRALMGVSEALYIPAGLSLIADYHSDKTRSVAIGIHMTGLYVGQSLGGFGATIAEHYSWQETFHVFGIIGIVYALILLLLLKEQKIQTSKKVENEAPRPLLKDLKVLFGNLSFWLLLFYFTIPSLSGWGIKNWLPTLFAQNLQIEMAKAGPLSTIALAVSSLFGVLIGGVLSDKWIQKNPRGRIFTSTIGLGLTVPALLFLGFGHSVVHLVCAALCFGFGYGMFDANNMPILCQFVSPQHRGTAYGIMNMCGVFAGAFITNLLGKSTDQGQLGYDLAILAGFVLLALAIFLGKMMRIRIKDF